MIYYLKTANREELYAALVAAGAAREIENEDGEKIYAFVEGAEFDEIGAIVAPLKNLYAIKLAKLFLKHAKSSSQRPQKRFYGLKATDYQREYQSAILR